MKEKVSWAASPVKVKKVKKSYSVPPAAAHGPTQFWKEPPTSFEESSDMFDDFSSMRSATSEGYTFKIASVDRHATHVTLASATKKIRVEGVWAAIDFRIGQQVNVFNCPCCPVEHVPESTVVSDTHNLLTVESDVMPVTTFIRAFTCPNLVFFGRKLLDLCLEHRDRSLVVGTLVHSLIEVALNENNFDAAFLVQTLRRLVTESVRMIYEANSDERSVLNECLKHVKHVLLLKFQKAETEKKVTSFVLDLKGKIDIVGDDDLIEVKTGRPAAAHKAQVILYGMMHREHRSLKLFYTGTGQWLPVELKHAEVRAIVLRRSLLELRDCRCNVYCAEMQDMDAFSRVMWDALNAEEESRKNKFVEVFYVSQKSEMVVVECHDGGLEKILASLKITLGDGVHSCSDVENGPACVEVENAHNAYAHILTKNKIHLCRGRIVRIERRRLFIELAENMKLNAYVSLLVSTEYSDIFYKGMRYAILGCRGTYRRLLEHFGDPSHFLRKLDGESEYASAKVEEKWMGRSLDEIETTEIGEHVRSDKVGLDRYAAREAALRIPEAFTTDFLRLNECQQSALFLCLNTASFHLVHGMPGTGKTSVIVLLVKILTHYGLSVLIVAYTNLCLENIVRRLGLNVYMANRGRFSATQEHDAECQSVKGMRDRFARARVVTSTCFSFTDAVFVGRKFDFLVVDEGSQMHFQLGLVPIGICTRFAVFGDHLQLKPLTFSERVLSLSLFEALLDASASKLDVQYRMGAEIMRLANALFYNGHMRCGVEYSGQISFVDTGLHSDDIEPLLRNIGEDVVILCYFNSQVKHLRTITTNTVETVDKYQGSEAESMIVVFDPVIDCAVMSSHERLNVAITRAKRSLLLVGNRERMGKIPCLQQLLEALQAHHTSPRPPPCN